MEKSNTIDGWKRRNYRRAVTELINQKYIKQTHQGSKIGDPNKYRILRPVAGPVYDIEHNITKHPPPLTREVLENKSEPLPIVPTLQLKGNKQ